MEALKKQQANLDMILNKNFLESSYMTYKMWNWEVDLTFGVVGEAKPDAVERGDIPGEFSASETAWKSGCRRLILSGVLNSDEIVHATGCNGGKHF